MLKKYLALFKRKERVLNYYPGIYKFDFPYTVCPVRDENNFVRVYHCNVEIHVGGRQDVSHGTLATVIIGANDEFNPTNDIENIATHIRLSFFEDIFHQENFRRSYKELNSIRFLVFTPAHLLIGGRNAWAEYSLLWNDLEKRYVGEFAGRYSGYYSILEEERELDEELTAVSGRGQLVLYK